MKSMHAPPAESNGRSEPVPPYVRGTAGTIVDLPTRAFGMLPNSIAVDPTIEHGALVMIAARLTYAGSWVMTERATARLVRRGLARHVYQRSMRTLVNRGLIKRHREPNGRQGRGEIVDDRVCLPAGETDHRRRVERAWFNGKLSLKAAAVLLFIRACAGGEARPWHIAKRFGWSASTVKTVVDELYRARLVERLGGAHQPIYRAYNSQDTSQKRELQKTELEKSDPLTK